MPGTDDIPSADVELAATLTSADANPGVVVRSLAAHLPRTVLRYKVVGQLGAGGMGVVLRAYDPDLDRQVAIKVLHSRDATREAQGRLLREARAMAGLGHPNVVTVYDVGTVDGQVFVAMEYADGGTLAEWGGADGHSWREVVRRYVAAGRGLAAAHARGLVHRDFKPSNVLVHSDGRVQVADFGLVGASGSRLDATADVGAEAQVDALTRTGVVMGTPAYMAPEQFEHATVGPAADQFSFAASLYEALYRERAFAGDNVAQLRDAVLGGRVRAAPAGTQVPSQLRAALVRALSAAPGDRYPSMDALLAALERVVRPGRTRVMWIGAVATVVLILGVWLFASAVRGGGASGPAGTAYSPAVKATFTGSVAEVALAPDGASLAFVSDERLQVRDLADSSETTVHTARRIRRILWTSDSRAVAFTALADPVRDSGVYVHDRASGRTQRVSRAVGSHVCELRDRVWAVLQPRATRVDTIDETGRIVGQVRIPAEVGRPAALHCRPGAKRILVTSRTRSGYAVWTVARNGSVPRRLTDADERPYARLSHDGRAVYFRRTESAARSVLMRVAVADTGEPAGDPVQVLGSDVFTGEAAFSIARDGALAHIRGGAATQLVAVERVDTDNTSTTPLSRDSATKQGVSVSPDGKRIAFSRTSPRGAELVVQSLEQGQAARRVASLSDLTHAVAWSPDGTELAYIDGASRAARSLWVVAVAGGAPRRVDTAGEMSNVALDWAPGARIAYQAKDNKGIQLVDPQTGAGRPLVDNPTGWLFMPRYAPDGRSVAFYWNRGDGTWMGPSVIELDSGRVRQLPGGIAMPVGWAADGRSLYVLSDSGNGTLIRVDLSTGIPATWLRLPSSIGTRRAVDMVDEGRFIVTVDAGQSDVWISRPQ